MFAQEAREIGTILGSLRAEALSPCLNIGSGTAEMRQRWQPHMHAEIFGPLDARGVRVVHQDLHDAPGVDIPGDLYDPLVRSRLTAMAPRLVLCCNLLEHVTDRASLIGLLRDLVPPGGLLLVTVPFSFQYHADPIDTMYRPSPAELAGAFRGFEVLEQRTIDIGRMWGEFREGGGLGTAAWRFGRFLTRMVTWAGRGRAWLSHVHSTLWLLRARKVSLILVRRPG
jgi:hypothetical protein